MQLVCVSVVVAAVLVACGGEEEASPEPTGSPSVAPPPTSPRGMSETDFWFRGIVAEMNTGCYHDAICSVTAEVSESLGGGRVDAGRVVEVITSYGFSTRQCEGQWAEVAPGRQIEVLAHQADGDALAVCDGGQYFVR